MSHRRLFGMLILSAGLAVPALAPAFAQTAGSWSGDASKVTLTAADGSAVVSFQCDAVGAELVVASSVGAGVIPTRITVRANNGTAYSVPLTATSGGDLMGGISTSLVNQQGFAQATTIIVSAPPSARPEIIVDVVPELTALIAACPIR